MRASLSLVLALAVFCMVGVRARPGAAPAPADDEKIKELMKERLHLAAHLDDVAAAVELLDDGANYDRRDSYGWTPIMRAASSGSAKVIRVLANHGADVNAFDSIGWTALLEASSEGHAACVRELLKAGASPGAADGKHGWTPLMRAATMGHSESVSELLKAGAAVDQTDKVGSTALTMAKSAAVANLLLAAGAEMEHTDDYGMTPLMTAVIQLNTEVVEALVKAGANVNAADREGTTVFGWVTKTSMPSVDASRTDIEELLLDAGAHEVASHDGEL